MEVEKITISNIHQFVGLIKKAPGILNLGAFGVFRPFLTASIDSGCARCARNRAKLDELRPQFEASLAVLSAGEQTRMKALLEAKKICYWSKAPNGQLQQHCF